MVRRRVWFVGVSTSGSSAIALFPGWCAALGIDAELVPVDLAKAYRQLVGDLGADQEAAGAVVTTHKVAMFETSADLFISRDRSVDLFEEISCVTAGGGGLGANTIDPASVARTLSEILPRPVDEASALVFGAGGAGTAVSAALLTDRTSTWNVTLTDTVDSRLAQAERIFSALSVQDRATLVRAGGSEDNDDALSKAPPGSLSSTRRGWGRTSLDLRCLEGCPSPIARWCGISTTEVNSRSSIRLGPRRATAAFEWRTAGGCSSTAGPRACVRSSVERWRWRHSRSPPPGRGILDISP
jgi:hypothetical protein